MSQTATTPTIYLLDTNIISDMMRNPTGNTARQGTERAREHSACQMATSVIVECELLFGLRRRPSERWQQRYQLVMNSLEVLPLEPSMSETYAQIRAELEALGTPIGPNDTLIAAHALALGARLVTADAEFSRVPGLMVENWLQPSQTLRRQL